MLISYLLTLKNLHKMKDIFPFKCNKYTKQCPEFSPEFSQYWLKVFVLKRFLLPNLNLPYTNKYAQNNTSACINKIPHQSLTCLIPL